MQDLHNRCAFNMMTWIPCEMSGHSIEDPQVMKTYFVDPESTVDGQACVLYRASITVHSSFSEVMSAIASSSTEEYRKQMRNLYPSDFVDGICLHSLPPTKPNRPRYFYKALKWCALQPPSNGTAFDFCFLEYAGIHKDANKKVGFCIQQSVTMDKIVPDFAHRGLLRNLFTHTGILVTTTVRKNVLHVISYCQIQGARLQPAQARHAEVLMFRRVAALRNLALYLESCRLGKIPLIERWRWIPDTARRTCAVCAKTFMLRRKHHCRQCGEVVCNLCAPLRDVDMAIFGATRMRICQVCVLRSDVVIKDDQCRSSVLTGPDDMADDLRDDQTQDGAQQNSTLATNERSTKPVESTEASSHSHLPYPLSFNQASDVESRTSMIGSDETDFVFATNNYLKIMRQLQENQSTKTTTERSTDERRALIPLPPPPRGLQVARRAHPADLPVLTSAMKATLLARQAKLRERHGAPN
ncbi:unnamed protein product [Aphanomyces euteiches]